MINRTTENILYYCVISRNKTRFYTLLPLPLEGGVLPENIIAFLPFFSTFTTVYPIHPKHANATLATIAIIPTRHPIVQLASKYRPCLYYPIFPTLGTTARKNLPSSSDIILFLFSFPIGLF